MLELSKQFFFLKETKNKPEKKQQKWCKFCLSLWTFQNYNVLMSMQMEVNAAFTSAQDTRIM